MVHSFVLRQEISPIVPYDSWIIYNRPKKKKKEGYEQVREHSHPCVPILKMHFGLLSFDLSPQQVSCQWGDKEVNQRNMQTLMCFQQPSVNMCLLSMNVAQSFVRNRVVLLIMN